MKVAQRGRVSRIGGLVVITGTLLLLTASANASTGGTGTGMAITVQNALASTLLGAGPWYQGVDIPKKAVSRSPFKPPDDLVKPKGPPAWANGKALGLQKKAAPGLQKDPPWAKAKVKVAKAKK
jgi:hypothetical protein